MHILAFASAELAIVLLGISRYTGFRVDRGTASYVWRLIDLVSVAISVMIVATMWCDTDPVTEGIKWALSAVAVSIVVLQGHGERVTAPIWKYVDGMNLSLLTAIVLSNVFGTVEGLCSGGFNQNL